MPSNRKPRLLDGCPTFAPAYVGRKRLGGARQTLSLTKPLERISENTSPQKKNPEGYGLQPAHKSIHTGPAPEEAEKNRKSPDALSPEGTGQSVARHGSAGYSFTQIESRRDDTMAVRDPATQNCCNRGGDGCEIRRRRDPATGDGRDPPTGYLSPRIAARDGEDHGFKSIFTSSIRKRP
jgi:hypothetical protein